MSSKREREQEHRRRQGREAQVAGSDGSRGDTTRRNALVAAGVVVVVVGVFLALFLLGGDPGPEPEAGATADVEATAEVETAPPEPQTEAAPTAPDPDNPCPPGPGPAQPVQVDEQPPPAAGSYQVTLATTCGDVVMTLDGDAAPEGVGSFLGLAEAGFFDGTPCHRLTTAGIFVLQCGDPTGTGTGGPGYRYGPVENDPDDGVYPAGTVAMARVGNDPESMGSQFFLVYEDSTIPSDAAGGYTVLGQVTAGLDIVQLVAEGGLGPDQTAPARSIGIESVTVEETA